MTIEPVQVVEIVELFGKKVWIESDFFGAKHVMVQHDAPGEEPFCYASFHYDYRHTSNSTVTAEAKRVAADLGAVEPIERRNRGWPANTGNEPRRRRRLDWMVSQQSEGR